MKIMLATIAASFFWVAIVTIQIMFWWPLLVHSFRYWFG